MEKKLTIGLFIDTYFPMVDGVTMVVDNYARSLSKDANVIVFAPNVCGKKFDDSQLPYRVVRCKSIHAPVIDYSLPIPKMDNHFKKILKNEKLDIVHIHSPFMVGKMGIQYAKKHHIPVIGTMHSQFKKDLKRAVKVEWISNLLNHTIIKTFNQCDECWAVNNEVARIFHDDYGYKTMPKVMNNATEMMPVKDIQEANETINQLHHINKDEKVFLFVGRLNNLKNIFLIVESLKLLKEKNKKLKFKMLFVGTGQDEEKLKELIHKDNMEKEILLCGKVTDKLLLAKYYCRADLFLFPSLYDASSIVQIEAASQKTPGVFMRQAATAATVTDNVNGYLSENNVEQYADKILEILNHPEQYQNVANRAYQDLYKNWDMMIQDVKQEYLNQIHLKQQERSKQDE